MADTGSRAAPTESLIDRESEFQGTYRTPHNLRIDGRYEGEIECRGTVFVGETAGVNARIIAGNVTVAGRFEGEIACDTRFEILKTGRVSGSVSAAVTVVHEGAFYQGELRMTGKAADSGRRDSAILGLSRPVPPRPAAPPPAPPPAEAAARPASVSTPASAPTPTPERPAAGERAADRQSPPGLPRRRPTEPATGQPDPDVPASLAAGAARANGNGNGRGPATGEA